MEREYETRFRVTLAAAQSFFAAVLTELHKAPETSVAVCAACDAETSVTSQDEVVVVLSCDNGHWMANALTELRELLEKHLDASAEDVIVTLPSRHIVSGTIDEVVERLRSGE